MKDALTEIVGNLTLRRRLGEDVLSGTLPHACILEGPKGSGKKTIATMVAAALVCEAHHDPLSPVPCLKCPSCRKVLEGKSPDVITVGCEDKATIGVDAVRFLREDVRIVPNDSDTKVYLIEDADKMTPQAQNALLLTLEEPPSYVHFFLLCNNAGLLLETIRSRAPIFRTEPIPIAEIDRYLCERDRRAAQMKLSDPRGYAELLTASEMGIGQALDYLDPKVFAPIRQTRALTEEFVRSAICEDGAKKLLPMLLRFPSKREALSIQLQSISKALRDLILLKKNDGVSLLFYADRENAIELCDRTTASVLYRFHEAVEAAIEENKRNANTRLMMIKLLLSAQLIA